MKGIRFYLEYRSTYAKRKRQHSGTVFAAFIANGVHPMKGGGWEGLGAITNDPNSDVCGSAASWEYLRKRTRRISESEARQIHPKLFSRLDN